MARPKPMFSRETDLTGLWSGEYWYGGAGNPTPFSAHLVDTAGEIEGTTLEPNTWAPGGPEELSATLTGQRGDLSVRFIKLYTPAAGVHHLPIFYSGLVDPGLTMIDGDWRFEAQGQPSGRFVLVRVSRGAQAKSVERAVELIVNR